jgi:hypothetical protein
MKTLKFFIMMIAAGLSSTLFYSCLDDDGYSLGDFTVRVATIVPIGETSYYLRLDDGKTLWPAAPINSYYKPQENQRAIVNYTILSDAKDGYDHWVKVNGIENILTKNIAASEGIKNDSIYGTDPVGLTDLWIGDNYLNVGFKAYFGGVKKHFINLIPSDEDDSGLVYELRHNAYDDPSPGYLQKSLVAFRLPDFDTPADAATPDSLTLSLKVKTFDGDKVYKIKFATKEGENNPRYLSEVFHEGLE